MSQGVAVKKKKTILGLYFKFSELILLWRILKDLYFKQALLFNRQVREMLCYISFKKQYGEYILKYADIYFYMQMDQKEMQ